MKKGIFIISIISMLFTTSCNTSADGKIGDVSIESAEGDKVIIKIKPKVGDTQKGLMTMNMKTTGAESLEVDLKMAYDLTVSDFKDSFYTYDVMYNSVEMSMDMGGMKLTYNSNEKSQEGFAQIMHQSMGEILNKNITMKMDEMGNVSELLLPGVDVNQQADLGSMVIPLPKEAVGVNDTWNSEKKIEDVGMLKMTMTLKKINVDDVVIDTKGTIESNGQAIGTFDGEYKLFRNNGLTKDGTMNIKAKVEGQNINMKVNFKAL